MQELDKINSCRQNLPVCNVEELAEIHLRRRRDHCAWFRQEVDPDGSLTRVPEEVVEVKPHQYIGREVLFPELLEGGLGRSLYLKLGRDAGLSCGLKITSGSRGSHLEAHAERSGVEYVSGDGLANPLRDLETLHLKAEGR